MRIELEMVYVRNRNYTLNTCMFIVSVVFILPKALLVF